MKTKPVQLWFKDEETAHAYWQEHFGGEYKDYDDSEAAFTRWCESNNLDFSL